MTWWQTGLGRDGLDSPVASNGVLVGIHEDRVWAIEDRCSHAGCAFSTDGEVDGRVVICNCHGSEFDVFTGEVLVPPAEERIRVIPIRVVEGSIEVAV